MRLQELRRSALFGLGMTAVLSMGILLMTGLLWQLVKTDKKSQIERQLQEVTSNISHQIENELALLKRQAIEITQNKIKSRQLNLFNQAVVKSPFLFKMDSSFIALTWWGSLESGSNTPQKRLAIGINSWFADFEYPWLQPYSQRTLAKNFNLDKWIQFALEKGQMLTVLTPYFFQEEPLLLAVIPVKGEFQFEVMLAYFKIERLKKY